MKLRTMLLMQLAAMTCLTSGVLNANAQGQSDKPYQQMTRAERSAFVAAQARRIARDMSGRDYEFTPAFEEDIQQAVNHYARRIGNGGGESLGRGDARIIFERGQAQAPTLIGAFKARNVSPLIGLYIPLIESEYVNIQSPNTMGAIGMFQFLPQTGERYGLLRQDLLDVSKSADAAARYISDGLEVFKNDPMKEALAVLAYNRGAQKTTSDLKQLLNDQNRQCSVCALAAERVKLDETFRKESVFYVPRFFAAAIIGEHPRVFGLQIQPLSSYESGTW